MSHTSHSLPPQLLLTKVVKFSVAVAMLIMILLAALVSDVSRFYFLRVY